MILHREEIAVQPGPFPQMKTELSSVTPPTPAPVQNTGSVQNRCNQSENTRDWNSQQKNHMPQPRMAPQRVRPNVTLLEMTRDNLPKRSSQNSEAAKATNPPLHQYHRLIVQKASTECKRHRTENPSLIRLKDFSRKSDMHRSQLMHRQGSKHLPPMLSPAVSPKFRRICPV